jgi:hypothetical protein
MELSIQNSKLNKKKIKIYSDKTLKDSKKLKKLSSKSINVDFAALYIAVKEVTEV